MVGTILITGANRGLGLALAKEASRLGYRLILHIRDKKNINAFKNILKKDSVVVTGDLLSYATILKIKEAVGDFLDILVNNAGIYSKKPLIDFENIGELSAIIDTNLTAPILLTKELWSALSVVKGMVININSVAGRQASENESVYCASKFGLTGFSEAIAFEASRSGIGIYNIILGAMKTGMTMHRKDWNNLIDPDEAAKTVFSMTLNRDTLRVVELKIVRKNR